MADRMTAGQLDGLDTIHECEHCEGGAHCVTRGLINEVRESWAEHAEAKRLLLEALRQRVDARAERDRLRDGIRQHHEGGAHADECQPCRTCLEDDYRLWALLDGEPSDDCTHESVDTFSSGAGRRVDVCMVCNRALRFWFVEEATDG